MFLELLLNTVKFQDTNNSNGVAELQLKIAEEEEVRRRWRVENVRRRHNYLPFIVELLKSLASKEQLVPVKFRLILSYKILTGLLKRSRWNFFLQLV